MLHYLAFDFGEIVSNCVVYANHPTFPSQNVGYLVDKGEIFVYYIITLKKQPVLAREGTAMNKKFARILCIILAAVMVFALVGMVIPMLVG